jgi:four helix bundle protein
MNPDEAAGPDEEFLDRLVAYDEALTAGSPPPLADASLPPQLAERLQRAQACVRRLKRDRRPADARPDQEVPPFVAGGDLAFDTAGWLTRLGRFRIVRELGHGGCGVVYLAQDALLGREVALKVPRLGALVTPELRRRFLREARAAADIDHPNVVAVYEVGEVGPFCYLVSAYCPGKTLAAWLKEQPGPVPITVAVEVVAILAEAVHHVHGRGILHRDLKPANILLMVEGGGWRVEGGGWRVEEGKGKSKEKAMGIQSYRELEVWRLGMDLAEECYRVTKGFPKEELFGMTSQIRRAAASIPANIAEGQGREHTKEFLHHLSVARGSLMELETHLMLSQRVGLLDQAKTTPLLILTERISRMLSGLRKALAKRL